MGKFERFTEAQTERASVLNEVVEALERGYHGQAPSRVHPADYITKAFQLDGHENLNVRVVEPDPRDVARARLSETGLDGLDGTKCSICHGGGATPTPDKPRGEG